MAYVRDRWTDQNPELERDPAARPRRIHNQRWGKGRRWQAVWTDAAGKRQARACASKDEAEKVVRDRDGRQAQSGPVPLDRWLHDWAAGQLHWSASTRRHADTAIDQVIVPALAGESVQSLTRQRIQDAVNGWAEQFAPATVKARWPFLRGAMSQAVADGVIERDPCVGVRLPRLAPPKTRVLTAGQVATIVSRVPERLRSLVIVGAASGLRPAELWGLTWDHVQAGGLRVDRQLRQGSAHDPKWGPPKTPRSNRTVSLGPAALEVLADHWSRWGDGVSGLVWTSRANGALSTSPMVGIWHRAVDGMGLWDRSGWHDLRHFHASALIHAGMSPRAVADRLGHADVTETLRVYSHLWPSDDASMAAVGDEIAGALSDT
ncbi:TraSA:integrase fusion protein [Acidipropionibacterium acidipropionici ATCC 4875]|uniref:TraSA:integrase fusion protein n=1 Tax=Acidipropionibacterium acidipropionici (strain ATCC 4875 / DSM 20272 / JCM 6432 / NBRC 12425 / NCIMB 8070 / 4) TaxID=1171373 RepID=K7SJG8_ACIA4|nr:site-specific integrase [Acidipropionibacterium acidipropionici]AFV89405.1 TraSA:integrase fusion protein [Acidipropionibacterium acidipropionici ATCC 4875]